MLKLNSLTIKGYDNKKLTKRTQIDNNKIHTLYGTHGIIQEGNKTNVKNPTTTLKEKSQSY